MVWLNVLCYFAKLFAWHAAANHMFKTVHVTKAIDFTLQTVW